MTNPAFTVRFYIRPTAEGRGAKNVPTNLRIRVWVGATKDHLYLTTKKQITPLQFSKFSQEGAPQMNAEIDQELIDVFDTYRAAVTLVLAAAIVNNNIDRLKSDELTARVEGVISQMRDNENATPEDWRPVRPYLTPIAAEICQGCYFRGKECAAPWGDDFKKQEAPERAERKKCCFYRVTEDGKNSQPTPAIPSTPLTNALLKAAVIVVGDERKKGGKK